MSRVVNQKRKIKVIKVMGEGMVMVYLIWQQELD